jgi:putative FmdB family regulatory protein
MPTYLYRCSKCEEDLEIWQSFDEKPKTRHAGGCGGRLTKVLQPAGIVLKGSGFYKTDSRQAPKSGAKTPGSSEATSSSSSSGDSSSSSSSANGASPAKKETSTTS